MKEKLINVVISALVGAVVAAVVVGLVGGNQSNPLGAIGTRFPHGIAVGGTTSPNDGELLVNGTTTVLRSYDGYVYSQAFSNSTSTNGLFSIQNKTGVDQTCNDLITNFTSSGYTSSFRFSVGTSSTNAQRLDLGQLIATTTVATTSAGSTDTTYLLQDKNNPWRWKDDEFVIGSLFDEVGKLSSSTGYTNLAGKVRFQCWLHN